MIVGSAMFALMHRHASPQRLMQRAGGSVILLAALIGFAVWGGAAAMLVALEDLSRWMELLPLAAFLVALLAYPRGAPSDEEREHVW